MKIEYDYTDARTGPPKNFRVTVEDDQDLREAVGLLLSRELNRDGRTPLAMTTTDLDVNLTNRPKYVRRGA